MQLATDNSSIALSGSRTMGRGWVQDKMLFGRDSARCSMLHLRLRPASARCGRRIGSAKLLLVTLTMLISSALFESVNKFQKIAAVGCAFGDEMKMIGHQAIGVERKRILSRNIEELAERPWASCQVREDWTTFGGADRDEGEAAAEVVVGGESGIFVVEGHA